MSLEASDLSGVPMTRHVANETPQIHYNEGADLLTYLVDPSVFAIKDGYVEALTGACPHPCAPSVPFV